MILGFGLLSLRGLLVRRSAMISIGGVTAVIATAVLIDRVPGELMRDLAAAGTELSWGPYVALAGRSLSP